MSSYINFILESGISLGVLTLIYFLFLRKETFFQINRIFLIASAVFSTILPLLRFTYSWGSSENVPVAAVSETEFSYLLETVTVTGNEISVWFESWILSIGIIGFVYLAGVAFMSLRLAWRMGQLGYLIQSGTIENNSGVRLIRINNETSPFSFFRWLFVSKHFETDSQEGRRIVEHELEHIKQLHSADVLAMEVISIVQWFNPFIWIMNRLVRENHEFLADRRVLNGGFPVARYRLLLLEQATGVHLQVSNNFNRSILKKRIKMMSKIESTKWATMKLVAGAFAFALLTIVFACENESVKVSELNKKSSSMPMLDKVNVGLEGIIVVGYKPEKIEKSGLLKPTIKKADLNLVDESKPTIKKADPNLVDEMPEFPGGALALRKFIAKTIKYPIEAQNNRIQGKVFVSFIVDSEGNVCESRIARGVHYLLDKEALRVVNSIPKWKPGYQDGKAVNVGYTVPITFQQQ